MDDISKVAPEQPKPVAAPLRGMLRNDAPLVVAASGGEGVEDGTVLWCFKIKDQSFTTSTPFGFGY